jgi:hypothetical protein
MELIFGVQEAELLYGFLASVIVPFVVSLIARLESEKWVKFALAVLVSVAAGLLSEFAAGNLSAGSAIIAAVGVFMVSQRHFQTWFKGAGFDEALLKLGSKFVAVELES